MKKKLITLCSLFVLALVTAVFAPSAAAAPITCPSGQTATKTDAGWQCVNNGGNPSGAGTHKGTGEHV